MTEEIKKLKEQRDAINKQIAELETRELKKAISFEQKLRVWYESDYGIELDWIPSKDEYPRLRALIKGWEMDRGRTYDLREFFEDEIYYILDGYSSPVREDYIKAIEEVVEKNLHSFKFDW
jgi:hypothetical protein